jgi:Fe-Mn family superoxide dismutase
MLLSGLSACRQSGPPGAELTATEPSYPENALVPHISERTVRLHLRKHHLGYVAKAQAALADTPLKRMALAQIVVKSYTAADNKHLFNNAAQVLNHNLYWQSMRPDGGGPPTGEIGKRIDRNFGGYEAFRQQFATAATRHFGSGWIWLVANGDELKIVATHDAVNPLVFGMRPLIALDVWEHAYYLDYQNARDRYIDAFLDHLVNWDFAQTQLKEIASARR